MTLVKSRHNDLFKSKVNELLDDVGRDIIIHTRSTANDCVWCIFDVVTQKSSGIPEPGKVWSTHPDYAGTEIRCPNCHGEGLINLNTTTTVVSVLIEDVSGMRYDRGKLGIIPEGTKKLIGQLSSVLTDTSDANSKTLFDNSIKIVVDGEDYRVKAVKRFGLKDLHLFESIIELTDAIDAKEDALTT